VAVEFDLNIAYARVGLPSGNRQRFDLLAMSSIRAMMRA
jgi:hypothetical protein